MVTIVGRVGQHAGVYIGRKHDGSMHYGNPFSHIPNVEGTIHVKNRDIACDAFIYWIDGRWEDLCAFIGGNVERAKNIEPERRSWIIANLKPLKNQTLLCYCTPQRCHGNYLAHLADSLPNRS